jgi:hypothetical protein
MTEQVTRDEFDELVKKVEENTAITKQVHDIVATLTTLYHVAKWITAIGAALAVIFKGADIARGYLK